MPHEPLRPSRPPRGRRLRPGELAARAIAPLAMLLLLPLAIPGLLADGPAQGQGQGLGLAPAAGCRIAGTISAGQTRLPGVVVTVAADAGDAAGAPAPAAVPTLPVAAPAQTSTGIDGAYSVPLPGPGRYRLRAELAGFAPVTRDVVAEPACQVRLDLPMTLASRVPAQPDHAAGQRAGTPAAATEAAAASAAPSTGNRSGAPQRLATGQFQRVSGAASAGASAGQAELSASADDAQALAEHLNLPPGFSTDTLAESVTAFGKTGQTNEMLLFGPGFDGFGGRDGAVAGIPGVPGTEGAAGGGPGGRGGDGAFGGQRGGGGMRGGMRGAGGLGDRLALANRMRQDRPRGNLSYTLGGSPFDASPYSLTGQPVTKPTYFQQRISGSIGGQFKVPHLFDLGPKTSYFFNYAGNHSSNFYDAYSTVPSAAQRAGDFSSSSATMIDPVTRQPFPGNAIPSNRLDPSALALLQFIPLPNQPGDRQNYYYSTTNTTSSDDVSFRFIRSFGEQRRGGRGGGFPMGGGPGGPGGRGGGGGTNLSVQVRWHHQDSTQSAAFPTVSGTSRQSGWDVPVTFSFTRWGLVHQLRGGYNLNDTSTTNAYAYTQNIAANAGIQGVSTDPFDWGIPALSFSGFTGLRDISPSMRHVQTLTFADSMLKVHKKHNLRWGVDFKDERLDGRTTSNGRGSYVFTGLYTGLSTAKVTGADFADFLLGLPQQASVQYGPGEERFHSRSWNAFLQDDWRVSSNFTLNAGLRYEYQSPYTEDGNRLVNLDTDPNFTAAVPVLAGQSGPYTGLYPLTIVEADRNNFSPRVGLAWRPKPKYVVRAGYGINYSSVPYLSIAQKLASQPPFAETDTRTGTFVLPLSLSNAFGSPAAAATTNNYGVDRNYRIGFVQLWNVDVQREFGRTWTTGLSYIGTRGGNLDLLRAPNRGPTGTTITGVQPFIWESSDAHSTLHALLLRARKRMSQGVTLGGTYTWSKSMDDASSLGGSGGTVAQNDQDLAAEWSLSSFDVRHRFTGDFSLELPFGQGRRWVNREGLLDEIVGGWMLNGTVSFSSGTPFTPRVAGAISDVANGVNGTLRANYDGEPIGLPDPTTLQFFNTSAFSVPVAGSFGNAGRNIIIGPPQHSFNMGLMKNFTVRGTRGVNVRIQANNVLNTPVWGTIDTIVNSPTFGQVTSVRSMRSLQLVFRMNF
jgi:trimeric autotransporter adhesin